MYRKKIKAEKCQLNSTRCGEYAAYPDKCGLVVLNKLQTNFGEIFNADIVITECDLISMRSTVPLNPDGLI